MHLLGYVAVVLWACRRIIVVVTADVGHATIQFEILFKSSHKKNMDSKKTKQLAMIRASVRQEFIQRAV